MQETTNLKLNKPDLTDNVNVNDFNENADIIDAAVTENKENHATHVADYTQQLGTATLETTDKTLKGAINEVFQTGNNVKSDMVDALLSVDDGLPIDYESSWEEIEIAAGSISTGVKWGEGSIISAGSTKNMPSASGSNSLSSYVTFDMEMLDFIPNIIYFVNKNKDNSNISIWSKFNFYDIPPSLYANVSRSGNEYRAPYLNETIDIPVPLSGREYIWYAYAKGE